ncbi:hypothetical protein RYX36_012359 [Vicia faba]
MADGCMVFHGDGRRMHLEELYASGMVTHGGVVVESNQFAAFSSSSFQFLFFFAVIGLSLQVVAVWFFFLWEKLVFMELWIVEVELHVDGWREARWSGGTVAEDMLFRACRGGVVPSEMWDDDIVQ